MPSVAPFASASRKVSRASRPDEPHDAGGAREQREHADHGEHATAAPAHRAAHWRGRRTGTPPPSRPAAAPRRAPSTDAAAALAGAVHCVMRSALTSCAAMMLPGCRRALRIALSVSPRPRPAQGAARRCTRFALSHRPLAAASRSRSPRPPPCSARAGPPRRSRRSRAARGRAAGSRRSECCARRRPRGSCSAMIVEALGEADRRVHAAIVLQRDRVVGRVGDDDRGLRHRRHHALARRGSGANWRILALMCRIAFGLLELLLELAQRHLLPLVPLAVLEQVIGGRDDREHRHHRAEHVERERLR